MTILSTSAKGASFLILQQVASRGFTFLVNQILLRYLSPELLGLSTQLELYSITVLYFARESIRVASQRQSGDAQPVINLSYLTIILGTPLAYVLALLYLRTEIPAVPYFIQALAIYGVSCVIELFSEPGFIAAQQKLLYKTRAVAETFATVSRCLITCSVAIYASKEGIDIGVLPFALGQLGYGSMLLILYTLQIWPVSTAEKFSLLPRKIQEIGDQYILGLWSIPLCELSLSFFVQNSFKYILTQGDGLLIAALASLSDQGAYALASNYGGLIARMLFQPIEESSRNLFAKLCAPLQDEKKEQSSKSSIREARTLLQNVLRLYGIITLVACSIGPTLAPTLLRLVAGEKWANTGASAVLVVYCYYIPLLAINGVTEAFVAAVASNSTLHSQSAFMGVCFAVFASVTYLFLNTLQLGASGLVYANCVNMILRIVFNTNFFLKFFREQDENFDAGSTFPNPTSIALSIATAGMLRSEYISTAPKGRYLPVPNSVLMVVSTFSVLLVFFERGFLLQWIQSVLRQWGWN